MQIFQTRNDLNQIIKFENQPIIAEIGIFECAFSKKLFEMFNPKEMHLFDCLRTLGEPCSADENGNKGKRTTGELLYWNAMNCFKDNSNVIIHEGFSNQTLSKINNQFFDLIYVDADHSFEGCYSDLNLAYDKTKNFGWIAGHDFALNRSKCDFEYYFDTGVQNAVNRFCNERNLKINSLFLDGCISFAIQKTN
jgi:hypothetical protein